MQLKLSEPNNANIVMKHRKIASASIPKTHSLFVSQGLAITGICNHHFTNITTESEITQNDAQTSAETVTYDILM